MQLSTAKRWIGPGVGTLLLGFLLWRLPWVEALHTLGEVRLRWWIPALTLGAAGVCLRALRLHWVLGSGGSYFGVWRSVALGYLGGLVLPAGGGELVKVRTLMKARDLDLFHGGAAVTLDRFFDLASLAFGLALLSGLQDLPGPVGSLLRILGILLCFAGLFLVLFLARGKAGLARLAQAWAQRPRVAAKLERLGAVLDEAEHLRAHGTWIRLMALQVSITTIEVITASIALRALPFTVGLPLWAGLQVLMFCSIAFALPLLPGAAGSLQVAYILALSPWKVPISQALAYSLLAHFGHVFVVMAHGGLAFLLGSETRGPGEPGLS